MQASSMRQIRITASLILAGAVILAVAPAWLVPWGSAMHRYAGLLHGAFLPIVVSSGLLIATLLLPAAREPSAHPTLRFAYPAALAVGLLLIVEPLAHLLILGWGAWKVSAASTLALPIAPGPDAAPSAINVVVVTLLVPVCEEAFFRGRLLIWLVAVFARMRVGSWLAVLVTTTAFAAAHVDLVQMLFAIPLGLLLGYIRLRTGDLTSCMLAHACHNSLLLFAGASLISTPWIASVLICGGAALVALALFHTIPPPSPRRNLFTLMYLAGACASILLLAPFYQRAQDALWVRAAHHFIVNWRGPNDDLLVRVNEQFDQGRLDHARCQALYDRLVLEPCPHPAIGSFPRQSLILALLDSQRMVADTSSEQTYDRFMDLADPVRNLPRIDAAARELGLARPDDLASIVLYYPQVLTRWLPLPQQQDACLAQIMRTTTPLRRRTLLSNLEHLYPQQVAAVLLRLPANAVTPLDRRHLFSYYPQAHELIMALDPSRRSAWIGPGQ